jgi:hypothetical protein
MWNMVEEQTKQDFPNLKGDEFYKKVSEEMEDLIFKTQSSSDVVIMTITKEINNQENPLEEKYQFIKGLF